jgi:hypothetical protein
MDVRLYFWVFLGAADLTCLGFAARGKLLDGLPSLLFILSFLLSLLKIVQYTHPHYSSWLLSDTPLSVVAAFLAFASFIVGFVLWWSRCPSKGGPRS